MTIGPDRMRLHLCWPRGSLEELWRQRRRFGSGAPTGLRVATKRVAVPVTGTGVRFGDGVLLRPAARGEPGVSAASAAGQDPAVAAAAADVAELLRGHTYTDCRGLGTVLEHKRKIGLRAAFVRQGAISWARGFGAAYQPLAIVDASAVGEQKILFKTHQNAAQTDAYHFPSSALAPAASRRVPPEVLIDPLVPAIINSPTRVRDPKFLGQIARIPLENRTRKPLTLVFLWNAFCGPGAVRLWRNMLWEPFKTPENGPSFLKNADGSVILNYLNIYTEITNSKLLSVFVARSTMRKRRIIAVAPDFCERPVGGAATSGAVLSSLLSAEAERTLHLYNPYLPTVLAVDSAARVRWHAVGFPTEESVVILRRVLRRLLAEARCSG